MHGRFPLELKVDIHNVWNAKTKTHWLCAWVWVSDKSDRGKQWTQSRLHMDLWQCGGIVLHNSSINSLQPPLQRPVVRWELTLTPAAEDYRRIFQSIILLFGAVECKVMIMKGKKSTLTSCWVFSQLLQIGRKRSYRCKGASREISAYCVIVKKRQLEC